ncbi:MULTISPECIES: hypothetical protein [unclassified Curtobacterium]|uniref:hypothetical protein n=1 Tax=unclassified Curtobacterium TaxID=257496 RepID=UPI00382C9C25
MADDDRDTELERARLERVAWGSGSTEAEAARARIALADLDAGRRRRGGSPSAVVPAVPFVTGVPGRDSSPGRTAAEGGVPVERAVDAGSAPAATAAVGPGRAAEPQPVRGDEPGLQADDVGRDHVDEPTPGARSRAWSRVLRVVRSARARPWLAGGLAAAVVVAFGTGLAIGTVHPVTPSSPTVTPTAGAITLQQLLDAPQTYADQLPGSLEAPVSLHTTRLVFTNRSLSGDDAATPWNVWAGVGTDRSTICLVATADRLQATTACYPREDALHGSVSLSASSLSGTLTVDLSGGGVRGSVTNAF